MVNRNYKAIINYKLKRLLLEIESRKFDEECIRCELERKYDEYKKADEGRTGSQVTVATD